MPIGKLLRSLLGLGRSDSAESSESTSVTVEREPDEAPIEEPDADGDEPTVEGRSDPVGEGTPAEADAAASTDSTVGEPSEDASADAEAETVDRAGTDTPPAEATTDEASDGAATDESIPEEPASEEPETDASSVENVSGIGPAYAKRLGDAGVETVAELLEADPEALSERTDISAKRIGRWQDRAEES